MTQAFTVMIAKQSISAFWSGTPPFLFAVSDNVTPWLSIGKLAANFLPGLMFGWLFQSCRLEAAIIAHMTAHLVAYSF